MRSLSILLLAFLLLAFESPLLVQAHIARFAPDIVLVIVLYVGLTSRFMGGLLLALALGLLKDAFVLSAPVGLYMEIMAIAFLIVFRLSRRLALRGPLGIVLLTIVLSLGASLLELALSLVFDRTFGAAGSGRSVSLLLGAMFPQALITAPFGPVLVWALGRLDRLTTRHNASLYQ